MARVALAALCALLAFGLGVGVGRCAGAPTDGRALREAATRDTAATAAYRVRVDTVRVAERIVARAASRTVVVVDTAWRRDPAKPSASPEAPDTFAVPAPVVERLEATERLVAAQRLALISADTALAVRGVRIQTLEAALRAKRPIRWRPVATALVVGVALGYAVAR